MTTPDAEFVEQGAAVSFRDAWEHFWFSPSRGDTLGLMRILLGLLLLYNQMVWMLHSHAFLAADGVLPADYRLWLFGAGHGAWSLFDVLPVAVVHVLSTLSLVLFTVGWKTRWFAALSWVFVISYANRTIGAQFGFDQIATFLIAYLAIGNSGECYSVDAYLRRRGSTRPGNQEKRTSSEWNTIATRLIQIHLCVVYLFAGIGKLQGVAWLNGEAILMAFSSFEYQTMSLTWLVHMMWLVNLLTLVSLFWELSYAALIWCRWTRLWCLGLAVLVHLGIGLSMGMLTFGLVMIVANMAFLSPSQVDAISLRFRTRSSSE